jgi:hypothetical protein
VDKLKAALGWLVVVLILWAMSSSLFWALQQSLQ